MEEGLCKPRHCAPDVQLIVPMLTSNAFLLVGLYIATLPVIVLSLCFSVLFCSRPAFVLELHREVAPVLVCPGHAHVRHLRRRRCSPDGTPMASWHTRDLIVRRPMARAWCDTVRPWPSCMAVAFCSAHSRMVRLSELLWASAWSDTVRPVCMDVAFVPCPWPDGMFLTIIPSGTDTQCLCCTAINCCSLSWSSNLYVEREGLNCLSGLYCNLFVAA